MTDTEMLRNAISAAGFKYKHIAKELHLTPFGLQKKIENKSEFKASEIAALVRVLGLSEPETSEIFFRNNVINNHNKREAES